MKIKKDLNGYNIISINEPSFFEIIKKKEWLKNYLKGKEEQEEELVDILRILVGITTDLNLLEEKEQENVFLKIDVSEYLKDKQYQVLFLGYDESKRIDLLSSYIYSLGTQYKQGEIEELMIEVNSDESKTFVVGVYEDEEKADRVAMEIEDRGGSSFVTEI